MSKYVIDFRSKKQKRAEFKEKFKNKFQNGVDWCTRNKNWLIPLIPVVIGSATTATKVVGRRINLRKQESVKNLYCYDRSLGHYWKLKRELSNQEWLEIDRRKKTGARLADILASMNVLK